MHGGERVDVLYVKGKGELGTKLVLLYMFTCVNFYQRSDLGLTRVDW